MNRRQRRAPAKAGPASAPQVAAPSVQHLFAEALQHHHAGRLAKAERLYRLMIIRDPAHADALHLLGVIAHQVGHNDMAVRQITKAIALANLVPDFHSNLGLALLTQGKRHDAVACFGRALVHKPDYAAAYCNLGNGLGERRTLDKAVTAYGRALLCEPEYAEAHNNLGGVLKELGRLGEAAASYGRALACRTGYAEAHYNLGNVLHEQGKPGEAAASYIQAMACKPDYVEAYYNLGHVLHDQGRRDEAGVFYRQALAFKPDYAEVHGNFGNALREQNRLDQALVACARALACYPEWAEARCNCGNIFLAQGKSEKAHAAYRRALVHKPDLAEANYNLGNILKDDGALAAAVVHYSRAAALRPDYAKAYNNLGNTLTEQGRLAEATASYEQALVVKPDYAECAMTLVFTQLYRSGVGLQEILARSRHWNSLHVAPLQRSPLIPPPSVDAGAAPRRSPRIGFLSADFRSHAVGFLAIPAIEGLARAGHHLTCYSNSTANDQMTARFIKAATVWRSVAELSDDRLAELIRADGIDILIDLSGYTAGNRLPVFALRPAPIQIASWIGYPATTGMAAMDYILTDRHQLPPAAAPFYTEAVVRLPDSYIVFEPPADAPPLSGLPALTKGFITFCSFNVLKKTSPEAVALWSRILTRLPSARLLLKTPALTCPATRLRYAQLFFSHGIDPSRVQCVGRTSPPVHRTWMNEADIALDPFPYTGGLTTLESLWMGLPVVTLPGETFASRHSLGYLSTLGLTELVASNQDHYLELALELANDLPRLATLRAGMRRRMLASPLCDVERFTGHLETALATLWARRCAGMPATGYDVPATPLRDGASAFDCMGG